MKTLNVKINDLKTEWYIINAYNKKLGRLSTKIVHFLLGKNKVIYNSYLNIGDNIIVINADQIKITGNKLIQKKYYYHTGYPGGLRKTTLLELMKKNPEKVIKQSVKGMLPKNSLGRLISKKLKIYKGKQHPHISQQPLELLI
ncbi:50S ribosomal protein L13 [Candidatus Portiera aleyrodidarum]|uniref:Large ribosomal subunit protein uL13 n=1 Tax=Candidatus Portiera aleyrodidarum MED (Bemisia tabaci) TaxID=1163752 RepID=A0AAU8RRR3_9GAMM|nr:50S ribosomal protein L13 [Candidatus Portiera aleyrodidarum]AFQ24207.1 LSU ribosomal protein L13P [Candidatus Portiera aleyrodidarum BT-B-HRs]AFS18963.1 50S ribosomal protein L13 [Candidatus Portiera aleyrodidarum BT-QVLC]AFT80619.1 LSU ribosomal protein L13p (L13Ae) [Candidatus Portiera aleyrodidarum BT-QVLC]AFT80896.1 LSU ribosomal protein L13p (L13Ae) [Candidatus Portiera aleyrodidarum BT-B-HRs]AJF24185.1 50S ribosomal protein L13 [Candidatus Portiera aleyrodidarum MED (Bemisia tabaci)]